MKVLVVEEDRMIATAVKRGLEVEGYTVDLAFDGTDGLWLATEGAYDLIVLDIMLPGKNGYQVCADRPGPAAGLAGGNRRSPSPPASSTCWSSWYADPGKYAFDGDPNIVEVYIRRLRTRIDEPFGRHTIETVRGAGYRVNP